MAINWHEFLQQGVLGFGLLIIGVFILGAVNRFGSMFADRVPLIVADILSKLKGDTPSSTEDDRVTAKDLLQLLATMFVLVVVLPFLAEWFGSLETRLLSLLIFFLYTIFAALGLAGWVLRLGKRPKGWKEHLQEALVLTMFIMMIDVALDHRDLYRDARSSTPTEVSEEADTHPG